MKKLVFLITSLVFSFSALAIDAERLGSILKTDFFKEFDQEMQSNDFELRSVEDPEAAEPLITGQGGLIAVYQKINYRDGNSRNIEAANIERIQEVWKLNVSSKSTGTKKKLR